MKQFAIAFAAILATSAFAQEEEERPYILNLAYASADNLYLGLEVGNPVKLNLPGCDFRSSGECTGWQVVGDASAAVHEFSDFTVTEVDSTRRGRTTRAFEFVGISASVAGIDVEFENDCRQDENGLNETASIHVFVNEWDA